VAVSAEQGAAADALAAVVELFDALGTAVVVPESALDTVTAVSGTGPALLALAIEGMEDGGVMAGLPRATARAFARRAMLGAARRLVAGETPAEELRRDLQVACPPVSEGLSLLEEKQVRTVFEKAVVAAAERARQMRAPSGAC